MKITKDGYGIIIGSLLIAVALWGYNSYEAHKWIEIGSLFMSLFTVFCINFFRDPDAKGEFKDTQVLSPAQGKVVQIKDIEHDDFIGGEAVQVSVFLSVFNVHVNSHPISGTIKKYIYQKGKMLAAFNHLASEENEQTIIGIESPYGNIIHKQITGLIARRIICRVEEGQSVTQGERFGMIRFGSRCDIIMPKSATLNVSVGDKVERGESIIGELVG